MCQAEAGSKQYNKAGGKKRTEQRNNQYDSHIVQLSHISHFTVDCIQHHKSQQKLYNRQDKHLIPAINQLDFFSYFQ